MDIYLEKDYDIYLCYSRQDQTVADRVRKLLQECGWSVWWDRQIPTGESWFETLEQRIENSRCVLALLSQKSLHRYWVKEEMTFARTKGILIPVIIDQTALHEKLGYTSIQAFDYFSWEKNGGRLDSPDFHYLIEGILKFVKELPNPPPRWHKTGDTGHDADGLNQSEDSRVKTGKSGGLSQDHEQEIIEEYKLEVEPDSTSKLEDTTPKVLESYYYDSGNILGVAGRTARFFINSPLTPLLYLAVLILGLLGLILMPRELEHDAVPPSVDVLIQLPGATTSRVLEQVTKPLELALSGMSGVDHTLSTTGPGSSLLKLQLGPEENPGLILAGITEAIKEVADVFPPGASEPVLRLRQSADRPLLSLAIWSLDQKLNDVRLNEIADNLLRNLKSIPQIGVGLVSGGHSEILLVEADLSRLVESQLSLSSLESGLKKALGESPTGMVQAAVPLASTSISTTDLAQLIVDSGNGLPFQLGDVADVRRDTAALGALEQVTRIQGGDGTIRPAVILDLSKKSGADGLRVSQDIRKTIDALKQGPHNVIPANVEVEVVRDEARAVNNRVIDLLTKLVLTAGALVVFMLLAFGGLRPALSALLAIVPVILLTLFIAYMRGNPINQISLIALFVVIGVLIDDTVVVVENIYRRWLMLGVTSIETAVDAVREVGNPSILATLTVIAALLPIAYIGGPLGPYFETVAVLGAITVTASLVTTLVITPWSTMQFRPPFNYLVQAEKREYNHSKHLDWFFRRILAPILNNRRRLARYRLVFWGALLLVLGLFWLTEVVTVRLVPIEETEDIRLVMELTEGSTLKDLSKTAEDLAVMVEEKLPDIKAVQVYVGGVDYAYPWAVNHSYGLGRSPWQAEIHILLIDKPERKSTSRSLVKTLQKLIADETGDLNSYLRSSGARLTVLEKQTGLSAYPSIVAEIHGEDDAARLQLASDIKRFFGKAKDISGTMDSLETTHDHWRFNLDRRKAWEQKVSPEEIYRSLALALGKHRVGEIEVIGHSARLPVVLTTKQGGSGDPGQLNELFVLSTEGKLLPLSTVGSFDPDREDSIVYRKDLRTTDFVAGESSGDRPASIYGMHEVEKMLDESERYAHSPGNADHNATGIFSDPTRTYSGITLTWGGEWPMNVDTVLRLSLAYGAALLLIYILVVWEFGSFRIAGIVMTPIPLTLLGVIPGHFIFGTPVTIFSAIGLIVVSGILVRLSILLVEFTINEMGQGADIREAVIRACTARTRPILMSALTIIVGSVMLLNDPIFGGLAISMAFGCLAATLLTLLVVPMSCVGASRTFAGLAAFLYYEDANAVSDPVNDPTDLS